jgi:H-NS histone family
MIKLDSLNELKDDELRLAIDHAQGLLKQRDDDRKAKALNDARSILASVGLSLKDVAAGRPHKNGNNKGPIYHGGHTYRHPTNNALIWQAKGKKPTWLVTLEAEGGKAVEVVPANDNVPPPLKKTG